MGASFMPPNDGSSAIEPSSVYSDFGGSHFTGGSPDVKRPADRDGTLLREEVMPVATTSISAIGLTWNANLEEKAKKTEFWIPKFADSNTVFVHIPRTGGTSVEVGTYGMPEPPKSCT